MEEYIYKIGIRRKVPYLISGPEYIVTDNTDYRVELSPDEEWDDFPAKSFIYAFDNGKTVVDPVTGNTDAMPMVPGNAGKLHFGVSAGEMHTTTWVTIPVRGSVRRKGGVEVPPPTPDQYDKIMDMLNKVMGQVGGGKYPVEIFTEPASFDLDGNITYQVVMVLSDKTRLTAKLPSMGLTLTDVTQYGTTDPTSNTAGMTRQFYVNTVTGEMWTCTDGREQSTTEWRKLGRKMVLSGSKDPTKEVVEGEVDQLYVNTDTGAVYICTFASNGPMWYEWEWKQVGGSGGSGDVGTDITLGITGAVVGQTVKITEVDENGKPVKWEAADIPAQTDIDNTLSVEGSAADAKAVGDKVAKLSSAIANIPSGKDGVGIQSVVQTTTSTEDGGTNVVTVTTSDGTSSTFQVKNGSKGSTGKAGADGHTPVKGTDYFTAADKREIAEEAAGMVSIPDKLPNPNALTFTGAVTGIYDGSEPLNVEIPSGGSGGSAEPGYKDATTLFDVTLDDTTGGLKSYEYDVSGIEKTDVIIINILFPESYTGQITIANQSSMIAREFPSSVKGMAIGLKVMNGRYMHSCVSSANINARLDMPLSLFYGQLSGASGFERPNAPDTITKLKFTLSAAFVSGTRIRAYRW